MRGKFVLLLSLTLALAAAPSSDDARISHALDRLTFGARPGDLEQVRAMGLKAWIDLQLHPDKIAENPALEQKLEPLHSLRMSASEMTQAYPPPQLAKKQLKASGATTPTPEMRQELRKSRRGMATIERDLVEGKIYRAVYTNRQLAEVMADFWYNHFNVYQKKGLDRYLVTEYEREAIRPHVLGKFKDMLVATAQSPAMLVYLDNFRSVAPGVQRPRGKQLGLNENYGRELMELHTLGVDGGYTQKDVTEVARCFTGWTVRQPRASAAFAFNRRMHDPGEKIVLGVRIPAGGGMEDGLKVLDILARHPATARFISTKLAVRFVSDDPPAALIDRMAKAFTKSDGDIRTVMQAMLESPEFWSKKTYHTKMKSPLEVVASAVRALGVEVDSAATLASRIAESGEPLYRKQEPTGYSNASEEWVSTASLLARMNFGIALVENRIPGVSAPEPKAIERIAALHPGPDPVKAAGLYLGGPEFQRK
jgi:uncharacterized protein (DUF1800 family)